jgi:hypothetical protein
MRLRKIQVSERLDLPLLDLKIENGDSKPRNILVFLSNDFHKYTSKSRYLRTQEIYPLPVLQVRSIKS